MGEWDPNFNITEERNVPIKPELPEYDKGVLAFALGFERQNWLTEWVGSEGSMQFVPDEGYDALDDEANNGYDPMQFIDSRSSIESRYIRTQIDDERRKLKIIDSHWTGLVGEIAGSIIRPEVVGSAMSGAPLKGIFAMETSAEIGSEMYLQHQQKLRTAQESMLNIGAVAAGTLILGGAGKLYDDFKSAPYAWKGDKPTDDLGAGDNFTDTAGAARTGTMSAEDDRLVGGAYAETAGLGPAIRMTSSPVGEARALADELVDSSAATKGMEKGETRGVTVEAEVHQRMGEVVSVMDTFRSLQKAYVASAEPGIFNLMGKWRLNKEFDEQVGIALSNAGKHPDENVVKAAADIRARILEPRKQELIDAGFDIKQAKYASDYFPRIYDRQKIVQNYEQLKSMLTKHYADSMKVGRTTAERTAKETAERTAKVNAKIAELTAAIKKLEKAKRPNSTLIQNKKRSLARYGKIKDDLIAPKKKPTRAEVKAAAAKGTREKIRINQEVAAEAEKAARDTIQNMLGGIPVGHGIGALNKRTLALTDTMLKPFLEKRASVVLAKYTSAMDPYLIMKNRYGDEMLTDKLNAIDAQYTKMIDAAETEKQRQRLMKRHKQDMEDLRHMRDRILNRVQRSVNPASGLEKVIQFTKVFNISTQLMGIALTSIPDVARPIMAYGFRSFAPGLAKGLGNYGKSLAGIPDIQARRMGVAVQRTLNSRMQEIAELGEASTPVTAAMQNLWSKATLFGHWTDALESITAQSAMDWTLRMGKKAASGKPLSRSERLKTARMGFTESDLKAFYGASMKTEGGADEVLKYANTLEWNNIELAKKFEAGIGSDVRRSIVRIGHGDKPLMMDQSLVSLLLQYKSFAMASTNKMLLSGIQQRDMALAQGLLVSIFLGGVVEVTKGHLRGQGGKKREPGEMLRASIDRTGMLGLYNIPFNMARSVAFDDTPSRYAHRGISSIIGGSTVGQLERVGKMAISAGQGDIEGVAKEGKYLVPYANAMHMRDVMLQLGQ